eukprot:6191379-Pleurochrysis_carterae.AAC.1
MHVSVVLRLSAGGLRATSAAELRTSASKLCASAVKLRAYVGAGEVCVSVRAGELRSSRRKRAVGHAQCHECRSERTGCASRWKRTRRQRWARWQKQACRRSYARRPLVAEAF